MLSKKADYALKALIRLAGESGPQPMQISDLARGEGIPKKFLELILLELKRHGILESRRGRGGGYLFRKKPEEITVGQVIRILDGPLALVPCVSLTAYAKCTRCADEKVCGVRMVMKQVRDATAEILDGTTLAEVVKRVRSEAAKGSTDAMYYI